MDFRHYPRQTRWIVKVLAICSRMPDAVVVNSHAGQRLHERVGYKPRRWEIIPNGFDLARFRPDPAARQRLRRELGLPSDTVVVAQVARVDPMKNQATFLKAAGMVLGKRRDVHVVLIGKDTRTLASSVAEQGWTERVHLLGLRTDVDRLLPGADLFCLSSAFGEGFPNVLGEAMACGVPCVTTDVGDARLLVGETGIVVPLRDPAALAGAMLDLIDRGPAGRAVLGQAARARIEKEYALPGIIERYQALYEDLCGRAS
jgi:glycosyltransferase involved in cell wall biosynthesis